MDLAKLLSLLHSKALYFVRLDKLSQYDPFEGYYTNLKYAFEDSKYEDIPEQKRIELGINSQGEFDQWKSQPQKIRELVKRFRPIAFVNSWHLQEHESVAMWKIYSHGNEGIAIQSTYEGLIESLVSYEEYGVYIGLIKYIDYDKGIIPPNDVISPYIHKRKSFEYEKELRALVWTLQDNKNSLEENKYKDDDGFYVPVDMDKLIDKIYVAPNAPRWVLEIIKAVVDRFELKKDVIPSSLASTPFY